MERKLKVTKHLLERYVERFYKDEDGEDIEYLIQISPFGRTHQQNKKIRSIISEIKNKFQEAKETKSYLNNTNAILYLYETYGYDIKFAFFHYRNILFVTKHRSAGNFSGITCYDLNNSDCFRNITTVKYTRKHIKRRILFNVSYH